MSRKIVICGAGFLGSYIARELGRNSKNVVHLASRNPAKRHAQLGEESPFNVKSDVVSASSTAPSQNEGVSPLAESPASAYIKHRGPSGTLGDPLTVDVTASWESLATAFEGAHTVVSLVGILYGSPQQFDKIQLGGAENVAKAAKKVGARLVHLSAIGADSSSRLPYFRTKGLAERAVFEHVPNATVLRPSLVFGPGDGFFARFGTLSKFLPFMPVFGGGRSQFQPVYAGDIARFVALCVNASAEGGSNSPSAPEAAIRGKIIESGGPNVFTYREMMELVLKYTHRTRPIISLPWAVGSMQGWVLEKLPENILTLTRDQVEQLKMDNVAYPLALPGSEYAGLRPPQNHGDITSPDADLTAGFASLLEQYVNHDPAQSESSEIIAEAATTPATMPTTTSGVKKNAYGSYTYAAERAGLGGKPTNASPSTSTSTSLPAHNDTEKLTSERPASVVGGRAGGIGFGAGPTSVHNVLPDYL